MRTCSECDGPRTKCGHCGHYHCDDPTCIWMPIQCAQAELEGVTQ